MDELSPGRGGTPEPFIQRFDRAGDTDAGLRTLLSQLSNDVTQLAHDELDLAKLELRDVADTLRSDIRDAGRTLAKDIAKVGIGLSLALLAGLALTVGAILGVGVLLGGAFWAGGIIVGVVLLIAAAIAVKSATSDMQDSRALRFEDTKQAMREDTSALREEARETKNFATRQAREFKSHVKPGGDRTYN